MPGLSSREQVSAAVVRCSTEPELFASLQRGVAAYRSHGGKRTRREVLVGRDVLFQQFCAGCPIAEQCLAIAQREKLTGIAGGKAVVHGRVRSVLKFIRDSRHTAASARMY